MALEAAELVPRDSNIDRTIAGRYRITRRIGGGGMGVVYLAEHISIGKRVALKMLHAQFASDQEVVRRFLNEARAAALVEHRNIVDAIDFGQTDDGAPYLVLEYLEGEDLGAELERVGRLPVGRVVQVGLQVASALAAAHSKGIVHRDLKPENVYLVTGEPEDRAVRVLDFGISKIVDGSGTKGTMAGTAMGTPSYMAPEQFLDASRVDGRADVYALGVMLYQMLSGRLPIEASSFGAMAVAVMQTRPLSLSEVCGDVPQPIVNLVDGMLCREIQNRVRSMDHVEEALRPFAKADVPSTPLGAPNRPRPDAELVESHVALRNIPGLQPVSGRQKSLAFVVIALVAIAAGVAAAIVGAPQTQAVAPTATPVREASPPPVPSLPRLLDQPPVQTAVVESAEPEIVSRVRQARSRGDVRAAIAELGTSQRRREQLTTEDLELIAGLCEDTLRMAESHMNGGERDASEALRLAGLVSGLSLASTEHRTRANTLMAAAQALLDAAIQRERAAQERAAQEHAAQERAAQERAAQERAAQERAVTQQAGQTRSHDRRTRQLESTNPY